MLLTGPEVLFAGVDGWFSMNFLDYSCFDVDMREQQRKYGDVVELAKASWSRGKRLP